LKRVWNFSAGFLEIGEKGGLFCHASDREGLPWRGPRQFDAPEPAL
jgi:hypothetical protein